METRSLSIWNGERNGGRLNVEGLPRIEYEGPYVETSEAPTMAMKANLPERKWFRIGKIFDTVQNRVAVFKQVITSRDDYIPTDIVMGPDVDMDRTKLEVLEAWCTDPQHVDPPSRNAPCTVLDFAAREPSDVEKRDLANRLDIDQGPPTKADRQRRREEEKAKQRRAEAEEAVIRLAAKAYAEPHVKTDIKTVIRREIAPIMEAVKDNFKSVQAVGQRETELIRQLKDVAPQVADNQRKAILALIRKAEFGCSKIENQAAMLANEGRTLSEIAKCLPHKNGKAMTREGVRQVLRRFEKKSGIRGLFSKGTYRQNVRIESEAKEPNEDGDKMSDS